MTLIAAKRIRFEKNEARETFKKSIRQFVRKFLAYNSWGSDEDRGFMGITVHTNKHVNINPSTHYPEFGFRLTSIRQVHIDFSDTYAFYADIQR
ncbi:MAG: hypothetical protein LBS01_08480 [Prevotellaceae bacterium]|nr:hypothetical protein [Prevotellaceae bacterium]